MLYIGNISAKSLKTQNIEKGKKLKALLLLALSFKKQQILRDFVRIKNYYKIQGSTKHSLTKCWGIVVKGANFPLIMEK